MSNNERTGSSTDRIPAIAIELAEVETCWSQHDPAAPETQRRLGLYAERLAGGAIVLMTRSKNRYFNRLVGVDLERQLRRSTLESGLEIAERERAQVLAVTVPPVAAGSGSAELLRDLNFESDEPSAKLWRAAHPLDPAARTEFSVRKVRAHDASTWVDVVAQVWRTFGSRREWYEARVRLPNWTHYLAWSASEPVAAAALHVASVSLPGGRRSRVGHLVDGVTLRGARRRGAQSALIRRRIQDGLRAGCRWFTSETAPPLPRRPLVSYRNLCRQGFSLAYQRTSWSVRLR